MGMSCLPLCYKVSDEIGEFNALGDEPENVVKFCCMLIVHLIVVGTENIEGNAEITPSCFYFTIFKILLC